MGPAADGEGGCEDGDVATRGHGVRGRAVGKSVSPGNRPVAAVFFYDESISYLSLLVTLVQAGSCSGLTGSEQLENAGLRDMKR